MSPSPEPAPIASRPRAAARVGPTLLAAVRSAATYLVVSIYVLLVGPPALLVSWVTGASAHFFSLAHLGVSLGFGLAGIRWRVTGRTPAGRTAVYCANHESNVDPPLLFRVLHPRLRMLYKAEFNGVPVLGYAVHRAGFIAVERGNRERSVAAVERGTAALRAGRSFLIFPEGTRSRTGELLPFKKGGFVMAIRAQVPVVPVAIHGGRDAMHKGSAVIRPVQVQVQIGEPVETTGMRLEDRDRLIALVRSRIEEMLGPA